MLPGGTDLLYRQALAAGHEPYVRVEVWRGAVRLATDVVFLAGSVDATLTSRVSRTLSLTLPKGDYPVEDDGLFAPFGNVIRAYRGLIFADGERYVWRVFTGRITEVEQDEGACYVVAQDRAADVADAAFVAPENSVPGIPVFDEFQRLVSDGLPDATFGPSDSFFQTMPIETWEHDRAGALDEIAVSVGAFWYPLADGRFVMRKVPWTVAGDPVVTLTDTEGGTVLRARPGRGRAKVYNSVTVTGERTDGTAPVFHTAEDLNPASPTFVDGPFGRRNTLINLQTPSTPDAARQAAEDFLRRTTAFTESWSYVCIPDASVELGDIQRLDVRGRVDIRQVVAQFSMPLDTTEMMSVSCRAQVVGSLETL